MAEAYIVDAVRTPVGRRGGGLSQVHPADLGAHPITALVDRTGIDPAAVEDVIFGNVDSIGPQAGCIARTCWLTAGMPEAVPGTTIDRQCGSSMQAAMNAASAIQAGVVAFFRLHPPEGTLYARQRHEAGGDVLELARSAP